MGDFVKVAGKRDIPAEGGKVCEVGDKSLAVFQAEGKFYCINNICKHRGGPLGEGPVDGTTVVCPWHGWVYDLTTGESITHPGAVQEKYNVKVEGNDILVEI